MPDLIKKTKKISCTRIDTGCNLLHFPNPRQDLSSEFTLIPVVASTHHRMPIFNIECPNTSNDRLIDFLNSTKHLVNNNTFTIKSLRLCESSTEDNCGSESGSNKIL